ncbi:MAG: hypothetical protein ACOX9C_05450 [Kiritimatiellia bacterium]|jgi:hypothetical protein
MLRIRRKTASQGFWILLTILTHTADWLKRLETWPGNRPVAGVGLRRINPHDFGIAPESGATTTETRQENKLKGCFHGGAA